MKIDLSIRLATMVAAAAAISIGASVWLAAERESATVQSLEASTLELLDDVAGAQAELASKNEHAKVLLLARVLATVSPEAVAAFNLSALEAYVNAILDDPDVVYAGVFMEDGVPLTEGGNRALVASDALLEQPIDDNGQELGTVKVGYSHARTNELKADLAATRDSRQATITAFATATRDTSIREGWQYALTATLVTAIAIYLVVFATVGRPLRKLRMAMTGLATGDYISEIPAQQRADEVGAMAQAVEVFRANAEEMDRMRRSREQLEHQAAADAEARQRKRENAIGQEIVNTASALASGNLAIRVDLTGKEGVFARICSSSNDLADELEKLLSDLAGALNALAQGELNHSIANQYEGSFAALSADVDRAFANLRGLIVEIVAALSETRSAVKEIGDGAAGIASRAERQAVALNETATIIDKLAAAVRTNADAAADATQSAVDAKVRAEKGTEIVSSAVEAMTRIEDSSGRISEIITVIESISFQTNLLALNAAVEAARAGEAGKGFAVVASEVRTLAQQSAKAASDISKIILDSTKNVSEGVGLVRSTGQSLADIRQSVSALASSIETISASAQEQATGFDEADRAVRSMDSMTQKNSQAADANTQTVKAMIQRVERLGSIVAEFQISTDFVDNGLMQASDEAALLTKVG